MAERTATKSAKPKPDVRAEPETHRARADARATDESERALGRLVSLALPLVGLAGAIVVGFVAGLGSALLVVSAAALLGTIALLWASLRTLSGDAPLAVDLEAIGARRHGVDALGEQKRRVLRALKDLESEHAVGKIDPQDYDALIARYRDEAKSVMREMDMQIAPLRAEAEKLARSYLKKQGLEPGKVESTAPTPEVDHGSDPGEEPEPGDGRVVCLKCAASNEADATFCKQCGSSMTVGAEGADAEA
jgi:hypothetical protein